MRESTTSLFDEPIHFPDPDAQDRLNRLVGLDDQRSRLEKTLAMLVNPAELQTWATKYHPDSNSIVSLLQSRPPLVILSGDVGSGKTELATHIGDSVARNHDIDITLFSLSLSARGEGRVGEMTGLVSQAFTDTIFEAKKFTSADGKARGGVILLIDEADALAQSRESEQMHHEDRAGVNAFIRGIDQLAAAKVPAVVIMCTNRLSALDPAIQRRAAETLTFGRPCEEKRALLLEKPLTELGFSKEEVIQAVKMTGPRDDCQYGFTFSDLAHRVLPGIVLQAFPFGPVSSESALEFIAALQPTPPFKQ